MRGDRHQTRHVPFKPVCQKPKLQLGGHKTGRDSRSIARRTVRAGFSFGAGSNPCEKRVSLPNFVRDETRTDVTELGLYISRTQRRFPTSVSRASANPGPSSSSAPSGGLTDAGRSMPEGEVLVVLGSCDPFIRSGASFDSYGPQKEKFVVTSS